MQPSSLKRILWPPGESRREERTTALLMFAYSFLAMTAYNIIKPVTRSKFISHLGADNLPYVQLGSGIVIGVAMIGYGWLISRLPRRWCLPITQAGMALALLGYWRLFRLDEEWVSVTFYLIGLILGVLLISQFWTLANLVYDPRQAKRLFGFIGGGAPLGGIVGSVILARYATRVGSVDFLPLSAALMLASAVLVAAIIRREPATEEAAQALAAEGRGIGGRRALGLLSRTKHLQVIGSVIGFAAVGAVIIEQQLNMAAEAFKGQQATDALTAFLAEVQLWTSIIGFIIQVWITSRIHRYLGVAFALMLLPAGLFATAIVMLLNAALWAPALGRVLDQSVRYTLDKTTREILYMPLPAGIKLEAKTFVDVTADRLARGAAAVLVLVLIKPWGLGLGWQQLSYASVVVTVLWLAAALGAAREYQAAFRRSIETREMKPAEFGHAIADPPTLETLIQELASPEERRVLYAIDILDALDKRNLITPLLLYHESPAVRVRALSLLADAPTEMSARWLPVIQRLMGDKSPEVRAAAVGALASLRHEQAGELVRPYLADADPRIAMTAALVLAGSQREEDAGIAEAALTRLLFETGDSARSIRRDFAVAIRQVRVPHCRRFLIPLLCDDNVDVAEEAMRSIRQLGGGDYIFVPALISLLRHRRLKSAARDLLAAYGDGVLDILRYFLRDAQEDIWIRRHIPATIARIPSQASMDTLIASLAERDGFLRFKIIAAVERLRRTCPQLSFRREPVEALALQEGTAAARYLSLHRQISFGLSPEAVVARALAEKVGRALDRTYRLLSILYPWRDIAAARWNIEHGDARSRAAAVEYLDNLLKGDLRKRLIPLFEGIQFGPGGKEGSLPQAGSPHGLNEVVVQLIHDEDPRISAAASHLIRDRQMAGVAPELERMLAARNLRDRHACEAASWALASFRLPEGSRRSDWLETLPAVDLAARMRTFPLFASVTVDELFRIADAGRQVRFEPGRILCQEGVVPDALLFLLDGPVSLKTATGSPGIVTPPALLGFQELLEGRPMRATARTIETCVCLAVNSEEFCSLLADSSELIQGLFRIFWSQAAPGEAPTVWKGRHPDKSLTAFNGALTPIDRVLVLESAPVFSDVSAAEMVRLAAITTEVRLEAGSLLFRESDPPALYTLLSGEIALESAAGAPALVAGPNDVIGLHETLAGLRLTRHARVSRAGTALRMDRDDLFDLLAQRPDLLRQLFSSLVRSADSTSRFNTYSM
jgi:AAA family ATP:ADP antiporter